MSKKVLLPKEIVSFIEDDDLTLHKTEKYAAQIGEWICRSLLDEKKWLPLFLSKVPAHLQDLFTGHFEHAFDKAMNKPTLSNAHGIEKASKISNQEINDLIEETLRNYKVLEDERGRRNQIFEVNSDKEFKRIDMDKLISVVAPKIAEKAGTLWESYKVKNSVETWVSYTTPFSQTIAPISIDPSEPTYNRVKITPHPGKHPHFSDFLRRCSNSEALCAFIWSLFVKESNTQQYVWLYGDGGNGKSALGDFLSRCLGDAYMSKNAVNAYNNKNFSSSLVGKRLAVFEDSNSTRFVQSGSFKEITGGGLVEVEAKYEAPYSTRLFVKFLFLSNFAPELSSKKADLRRIILCHVLPIDGPLYLDYNDRLWEERDQILHTCKLAYEKLCVNGFITTNEENLTANTNLNEVQFLDVYDNYLISGGYVELKNLYAQIRGACRQNGISFNQMIDWLQRQKGVKIEDQIVKNVSLK